MTDEEEGLPVIGRGVVGDLEWSVTAGGSDDAYFTFLCAGEGWSGGIGGPKLWGNDLMNLALGRKDDGPLEILIRADPSVCRVLLVGIDGTELDLVGGASDDVVDGLRFFVGFAWPSPGEDGGRLRVREVRGLDTDGDVIETYDLTNWTRPHRPQSFRAGPLYGET